MKRFVTSALVAVVIVAFGAVVGAQRSTPPGRSGGGTPPSGQRPGGSGQHTGPQDGTGRPGGAGPNKPTTPPTGKPGKDGTKPCKATPGKPC